MERGLVTHVALNSAGAIHDFEIATAGHTSERVDTQLPAGTFGSRARRAGDRRGRPAGRAPRRGRGRLRARAGRMLLERPKNVHLSVPASAVRMGRGVTCHVSVGADIVHMHPSCDGADLGAAALADFQHVCRSAELAADLGSDAGGVWFNVGCAVILLEIFLKAVSVAINLGRPRRDHDG